MKMHALALPRFSCAGRAEARARKRFGKVNPSVARPPTRRKSRRLAPSEIQAAGPEMPGAAVVDLSITVALPPPSPRSAFAKRRPAHTVKGLSGQSQTVEVLVRLSHCPVH